MTAVLGYAVAVGLVLLAIRRADREPGRTTRFERLVDDMEDER